MNQIQKVNNQVYELTADGISKEYVNDIRVFNRFADGRAITAELITEFFEWRKESGLSLATIQRNKSALKMAVKRAMSTGATLGQIAQLDTFFKELKAGKGRVNTAVTENKVLSKTELKQILKTSGHKTALIIEALYQTACRVSELCSIELKNCSITKDESGQSFIRVSIFREKTQVSADVFLPVDLFEKIKVAYQGNRYLFESKGKAISRHTIHTMIKRAGAKIGRPDIHAHSFRHTWATMAMPILGLAKVSKYLSHSSPDTTAKYYLHGKASAGEVMACNMLQLAV